MIIDCHGHYTTAPKALQVYRDAQIAGLKNTQAMASRTKGIVAITNANAAFGGSAEYVALWFKQEGMESGFYFYTSAVLAVGLLVVLILPDPAHHSLIEDD